MGELIECCLSGCERAQLAPLLGAVGARARGVVETEFHEEGSAVRRGDMVQATTRLLSEEATSCDVRIEEFSFDSTLVIHGLVVQVFPVDERFDLFMNFKQEETSDFSGCIGALNGWSAEVRAKFGLDSVYCGLDPADDEETRFFTNGRMGPLSV